MDTASKAVKWEEIKTTLCVPARRSSFCYLDHYSPAGNTTLISKRIFISVDLLKMSKAYHIRKLPY